MFERYTEKARLYEEEIKKERENLELLRQKHNLPEQTPTVTREDIEQIVAEGTGLSLEFLRKSRVDSKEKGRN